jgi:hypothetical protein
MINVTICSKHIYLDVACFMSVVIDGYVATFMVLLTIIIFHFK